MTKTLFAHASKLALLLVALVTAIALSACSTSALPTGLSARMDAAGATLDRAEALSLINQFRVSRGVPALVADTNLDNQAQILAGQYAQSGTAPTKPETGVFHMRVSAGYANFAETFSGWRSSSADADAIADRNVTRAGLGVAYAPNSTYGVHWVLLLSGPVVAPIPQAQ